MTVTAVLITGGTGYVAQFLCKHFAASGCHVGLTHRSSPPPNLPKNVQAFKVNLATGEGLDECLAELTAGGRHLAAVINCAAVSQPALCERDPAAAEAVNVPTKLLDALDRWWAAHKAVAAAAEAAAAEATLVAKAAQHQHGRNGIVRLLSRIGGARNRGDSSGSGGGGSSGGGGEGSLAGSDAGSGEQPPLLVHFSTDQVYDGSRPFWKEDDEAAPINAYGRTKLAGERAVAARWPNHAILRSSLIYGPDPPLAPVARPLFLQFVDGALSAGRPTDFYCDEWRCPIRVRDIVRVVQTLIFRQGELQHRLFNMGGPDRLSRVDMAAAVAAAHGYDASLARAVPAPPAAQRGVPSPADISMDSSRLEAELHLPLTPFRTALEHIFTDHDHHHDTAQQHSVAAPAAAAAPS